MHCRCIVSHGNTKIQALISRIQRDVPEDRRGPLSAFAKAYTRRFSSEDLAATSDDELLAKVCSTFGFADGRATSPNAVRVFNPTLQADGYETPGSVLETTTDDSQFLVDSVTEELSARDLAPRQILHPVVGTIRDGTGRIERILPARDAEHRESVMHFELDRRLSDDEREDLEHQIAHILRDVYLVIRDFVPMQARVATMIEGAKEAGVRFPPEEVSETVDFLNWLLDLNFVMLGYREYELFDAPIGRAIRAVPGSGLGILSDVSGSTFADVTPLDALDPDLRRRIEDGDLLVFSKTNAYSTVHRRARMG
jgi:glutamate dehydrogenase